MIAPVQQPPKYTLAAALISDSVLWNYSTNYKATKLNIETSYPSKIQIEPKLLSI